MKTMKKESKKIHFEIAICRVLPEEEQGHFFHRGAPKFIKDKLLLRMLFG